MKTEKKHKTADANVQTHGKGNCTHPMLHPFLSSQGFHTGHSICLKCDAWVTDQDGDLLTKELHF